MQKARHDDALLQSVDCRFPIHRNLRQPFDGIGVANNRRRRFHLVFDPVQGRAQNGGEHQIGVHVATCHPMFHPPCCRVASRNSDGGGAVFVAPGDGGGGVLARHEAFKTVLMGRKDQRRIVHGVQTARHRLFQHRGAFRPAAVKDVVAFGVDQAEMGVQAGSGIFRVRFGHEAGGKAVAAGQTLDQHLEEPGVIGGAQGIVAMHQVHLELAKAGFRGRGVGGNVHRLTRIIEVGEEGVESVKRPDRQRFRRLAPFTRPGRGRHLHGLAGIVDQEKFQFHRADRGQAAGLVAVDDGGQRMAGVALIGGAVFVEHPDRQQRRRRLQPGHRQKAAFGRLQHAVLIALFKDQGAVVDILAPDVEVEDRERKPGSVLHHLVGKARRNPFAARLPVQVGRRHPDRPDIGVFSEVVFHHDVQAGHGHPTRSPKRAGQAGFGSCP